MGQRLTAVLPFADASPRASSSPWYRGTSHAVTFQVFLYLFAEGDAVLTVQDRAVDVQSGELPQLALIIAGTVENGPAGYVARRGSRRMMVAAPWPMTQLPGGGQEPTSLPAMSKDKRMHKTHKKSATQTHTA